MMIQKASSWTPVYTDRLVLRRPVPGDRGAAISIHTDDRTNAHHPEPHTVTPVSSAARFDGMRQHWEEHGFGAWAVAIQAEPDTIIGFTGLSHRNVHGRDALNLYYRYDPAAWGKGFATEGARKAVTLADELLPGLPVLAYTSPDNTGSQRTALSAGLYRRGDLDVDHGTFVDVYLARGW